MITLSRLIKGISRRVPSAVNMYFTYIPFRYKYGKIYDEFKKLVRDSKKWKEETLEEYIVLHFNTIFQHAKRFNFYKNKFRDAGVLDLEIKNINDIRKIPILTREEIRDNITDFSGHYLEKTGGTSGNPLQLFLDKNIWEREFAHYHYIWGNVGYKSSDIKFVIKRQNVKDKFIKYNFEHNDFIINTYGMDEQNIDQFFNILVSKNVKYFQGFPSSIYDFLKELELKVSKEKIKILQNTMKFCFFSSEMPLPHVIRYIRNVWNLDYIACYGHTEACVLASSDINTLHYTPYYTYGYLEEENGLLVGTSYHNFDMPLIRYKTDDLIRSRKNIKGIVESFQVKEGRILDYFLDKNKLKIYYLDLFYESGGEIFNHVDHIQFHQDKEGETTLLITLNGTSKDIDPVGLMELDRFEVDFDFIYLNEPIRTISGKVPFKVKKIPNQ